MAKYQVIPLSIDERIWKKFEEYCERYHRTFANAIEWIIVKRMRSNERSYIAFAPPLSEVPVRSYQANLKQIYNKFLDKSSPRRMNRYVLEAWIREEIDHG